MLANLPTSKSVCISYHFNSSEIDSSQSSQKYSRVLQLRHARDSAKVQAGLRRFEQQPSRKRRGSQSDTWQRRRSKLVYSPWHGFYLRRGNAVDPFPPRRRNRSGITDGPGKKEKNDGFLN